MAYFPGTSDPESGTSTAAYFSGPGGNFSSPWTGGTPMEGWNPQNIDTIFGDIARSGIGGESVGAQTLAGLRQAGVDDQTALNALWAGAAGAANPFWTGGSPTGIMRGVWQHAGVLDRLDNPSLVAAQQQQDQSIWQSQQQGGDDFFSGLGLPALMAAAAFFGPEVFAMGGGEAFLGNAAIEAGMLGGSAAGAVGAGSFAPFAGIVGDDAIATMIKAAEATGAGGWTEAAQQLGFASPEAFLSSINPEWANVAQQLTQGGTPGNDLATTAATGGGTFTWPSLPTNSLALNPQFAVTDTLANAASGVVSNPVNIAGFPGGAAATMGADGGITDWWKKLMAQMANDPLKSIQAGGGLLSTALNIGSGILGLNRASQIPRQTEALMARSDPFGPYRAQYAQQLSSLAANPGSVTSMPGYTFARDQGEQALTRKMAQGGYTGSGNEMIALKQFNEKLAGDWYNNEMTRLATLAGAGISPSGLGVLGMNGINAQNDMLSRALASIGYGVRGL